MKEKRRKFDSKNQRKKVKIWGKKWKTREENLTAKIKGAIGKRDKKSSDSAIKEQEIEVIYIFTVN